MAKVMAETDRQPSPVWTVDPALPYITANQESSNYGIDNAAFYDSEAGMCPKLSTVNTVDPCQKKNNSTWENSATTTACKKKHCNDRFAFLLLSGFVLLILVATIATVAYLAVGEVRMTWEEDDIPATDEGISVVEGQLRITNRIFTEDLLHNYSPSFRKLTAQVRQSIDAVFFQSGLEPYYNETVVIGYSKGSVIVDCKIYLSTPRMDATHQVGMAIIQALERYHGYLPGGLLQVDIRSLHFTGFLNHEDTVSDDLQHPAWGPWSEWSPCVPCGVQSRRRECIGRYRRNSFPASHGPCGDDNEPGREIRNCSCDHVSIVTTEKTSSKVGSGDCTGDCEEGQICLLLPQTSVARCLVPRDVDDPTGCGGWCVGEHQICHRLNNSSFQCVDNPECNEANGEWRCGNGLCIPKIRRCDGQLDCYDMSDEYDCECEDKYFHCGKNTSCMPRSAHCNGQVDCWDGSDETNCTLLCPTNQYTCNNGRCIEKLRFCDGYSDCDDNSDEPEGCNAPCLHTQNQCRNGRCVNVLLWCNGVDNCGDESDEIGCDPPQLLQNH